jgi:hypothetical protein
MSSFPCSRDSRSPPPAGGGLAFGVGGRTGTIGVRYDVGFVKLLSDADSKNRVLSFMGTLEWPFRK